MNRIYIAEEADFVQGFVGVEVAVGESVRFIRELPELSKQKSPSRFQEGLDFQTLCFAYFFRRCRPSNPVKPAPMSSMEAGSGTGAAW